LLPLNSIIEDLKNTENKKQIAAVINYINLKLKKGNVAISLIMAPIDGEGKNLTLEEYGKFLKD